MASASGSSAQYAVDVLRGQRTVDAAGYDPGGVNPLAAEHFDDLLADLAQANAVAGQLRMRLGHAEDVALRRVGIHAEQQIGRRKVEET